MFHLEYLITRVQQSGHVAPEFQDELLDGLRVGVTAVRKVTAWQEMFLKAQERTVEVEKELQRVADINLRDHQNSIRLTNHIKELEGEIKRLRGQ